MKARLALLIAATLASALPAADDLKVPERTMSQRYNRLLSLDANVYALSIAYAKQHGGLETYAKYCGEQFAPSWNKQAGFTGFARGLIANFDIWRREDDPPVEVLEQSSSLIRLRCFMGQKRGFKDDKLLGTTFEEFMRWFEIIGQVVADHVGCTYKHESIRGDFVTVAITPK